MMIKNALMASAILLVTTGAVSAQNQTPPTNKSGAPATTGQSRDGMRGGANGMTGSPSSTNPQQGGGASGLQRAPHEVPENGGAPMKNAPSPR